MAHPEDEKGRGGVAGYAIAADGGGGGGDDDEESYITQLSALDRKEPSAPSGADASSRAGAFGGSCGREQAIAVGCLLCTRGRIWGRVLTRCSLGPSPSNFFPPRRSLLLRSGYSVSTFQLNLFTLRLSHYTTVLLYYWPTASSSYISL